MTNEFDAAAAAQSLVRIPSVTGSAACADVVRHARDLLQGLPGAEVRILEEDSPRPVLMARTGRGESGRGSVLLSGHLDVVPPAGMEDPWSAEIDDGVLHGRGACDMKGGAAACLAAFARAARSGVAGTVGLVLTTDEETDAMGIRAALASGFLGHPELALIAEPTALHAGFEHPGECWIEVRAQGRAAHSSTPQLGVNALAAAAMMVAGTQTAMPELLAGSSTTAAPTKMEGGAAENVIPESARVLWDFRYRAPETARTQLRRLQEIARRTRKLPGFPEGAELTCCLVQDWPPMGSCAESPAAKQALASLSRALGREVPVRPMSGWGEGGFLHAAGIPALYFGPGDPRLAHTPGELAPLSEIRECADALSACVLELAGGPA